MMRTLSAFAIAAVLAVATTRATPRSAGATSDENRAANTVVLTNLATEAGHAYARRDLQALERLTAEDYAQIDVRGGVLQRAQWLEFVKNRKSEQTVETDDVKVAFYGPAAVVTGHWTYTIKRDGKDAVTYSRWTSVWTRYPDGWKRHAFQNTYINPVADRCAIDEATNPETHK